MIMADPATNLALIQQETAERVAFQNGTKAIESLTGTERKTLENILFPIINGFRNKKGATNTDYTSWEIGDEVHHIDPSGKTRVVGMVIVEPFDPTADLSDKSKIDLYENFTKPAINI